MAVNVQPLQFIQDQLNKPVEDSKKWRMAVFGLKGLGAGFAVGIIVIVLRPEISAQVTSMVQIFMTAWGGIVGIYLGAQGSVEYKSTSAMQQSIQQNGNAPAPTADPPKPKPFSQEAAQGEIDK